MAYLQDENASWVHRILRIRPGKAPFWLCSRNACDGVDLPKIIAASIPCAALVFFTRSLVTFFGAMVLAGLFYGTIALPFERAERRARALRRQRDVEESFKHDN